MAFFKKKKKVIKEEKTIYIKTKDLMEHFKVNSKQLHEVLGLLKWAVPSTEKGWKTTELGINKGAKEGIYMGVNYIHWDTKIKDDSELVNAIKGLKSREVPKPKKETSKPKKMTNREKKEKGDIYELFICKHYEEQGYTISKHGLDNGVKDGGIDIIAKKNKDLLFIQCKNWSASSTTKVRDKEIKVTRQDVQDYRERNPLYDMYNVKILYVMSENVLHGSAYHYIQANSENVEFRIIPMLG